MRTTALGRRTRAGAALACALGALLALAVPAAAGTVPVVAGASGHGDHALPFSFD
jgi:hypothetical protein